MADRLNSSSRFPSAFHTPTSLLARVRSRDELAWGHFYTIYSPLILYLCRRWGLEGPDAEDVAQEVFQAVVVSIGNYRRDQAGQVHSFRDWLGGVIRNKIRTHYKCKASLPQARQDLDALEHPNEEADAGPSADPGEDEAYREVFRRALEGIRGEFAPRHWQAFWGTAIDNQPASAVAAELGMSPAAVRQAKSRVLRRLREEFCEVVEE